MCNYNSLAPTYIITGRCHDGRRFKRTVTSHWYAMAINLWRGSVWRVEHGKRKLVKRVRN